MASHLSHSLSALLERKKLTATALAAIAGIHQTTVSRACSGERLSVESLRALCTKQNDLKDGVQLLIAHLRDEVDRSGRLQSEIVIKADGISQEHDDIRILEEHSKKDENLAAIIHDLAQLTRSIRKNLIR